MRQCRQCKPDQKWIPLYTIEKTTKSVDSIRLNECPVGYITPFSRWLIDIMRRSEFVSTEHSQSMMFGPDQSKWPAWWVDALAIYRAQQQEELSLYQEK